MNTEVSQKELDNYLLRNKSSKEVGKLYEEYIGYLLEQSGWQVNYNGIKRNLWDNERDLIAYKDNNTQVIQCKRWSKRKTLHVKYIHEIAGTTETYRLQHPSEIVTAHFYATTRLDPHATNEAKALNISIHYEDYKDFPLIKGNITRYNEKIFYLPTDLGYDKVAIDYSTGENRFNTVIEAEKAGFRRTRLKWHHKQMKKWRKYS